MNDDYLGTVAPVVFGYAPVVQFDLLAGNLGTLPVTDRAIVTDLARSLISRDAQSVIGCASPLASGEVVLMRIPVDVVELASGRHGLSVVIGTVVHPRGAVDAEFHRQALALLGQVIGFACTQEGAHPADAATAFAEIVQRGDADRTKDVRTAVEIVGRTLSSLVLPSRARLPFSRKRPAATQGTLDGVSTQDPLFALCHLLAATVEQTRVPLLGGFVPLAPINETKVMTRSAAYRFIESGIVQCSPIPDHLD